MDQPFKHHPLMTERLERLQIENYALLTESATDLRARLQEWYGYYVPTSPGVCDLMEMAVMSSVQWRQSARPHDRGCQSQDPHRVF